MYTHSACESRPRLLLRAGTGLVHTAPGHGQEDYLVGQRCGLELLSPVDDAGNFTEEAGPRFAGLSVQVRGQDGVM